MPEILPNIGPHSGQGQRNPKKHPGCEWNPDTGSASLATSDHHIHAAAIWSVDAGEDGIWRLCNLCAQRAPFKKLQRRKL